MLSNGDPPNPLLLQYHNASPHLTFSYATTTTNVTSMRLSADAQELNDRAKKTRGG